MLQLPDTLKLTESMVNMLDANVVNGYLHRTKCFSFGNLNNLNIFLFSVVFHKATTTGDSVQFLSSTNEIFHKQHCYAQRSNVQPQP